MTAPPAPAASRTEGMTMAEADKTSSDERPARQPRCPICGKPRADRFRPFCSQRCADVDLHRWLTGAYAIPVVEEDDRVRESGPGEEG
jgi:endogenous inhibitor of DNA gyrase (YacG/DUF329 family)